MNELNALRKRRKQLGLSQKDMAAKLGITQQAYSKIESAPANCSLKKMKKIVKILDFDINQLFTEGAEAHTADVEVHVNHRINTLELKMDQIFSKVSQLHALLRTERSNL